jgi:UPF0271 protein
VVVVDLNADVGEWEQDPPPSEAEILTAISSANIACGLHAGDERTMALTVELASHVGVAIGAHPSLDDRSGFGRREMRMQSEDVVALVARQLDALGRITTRAGVAMHHAKPHGALYNMAARDAGLADAVAAAVAGFDRHLVLYGLSGSELIAAGKRAGLRTASEVFADRAYLSDGSLAPRSAAGAVIAAPDAVVDRAVRMVLEGHVDAIDGTRIPLMVDTICVHGDTPGAAVLARRIRAALEAAGVKISAPR